MFFLSVSQMLLPTLCVLLFLFLEKQHLHRSCQRLTNEAEDVPDGGDKDDQQVVEGQDAGSDQHVANPAELSPAE